MHDLPCLLVCELTQYLCQSANAFELLNVCFTSAETLPFCFLGLYSPPSLICSVKRIQSGCLVFFTTYSPETYFFISSSGHFFQC